MNEHVLRIEGIPISIREILQIISPASTFTAYIPMTENKLFGEVIMNLNIPLRICSFEMIIFDIDKRIHETFRLDDRLLRSIIDFIAMSRITHEDFPIFGSIHELIERYKEKLYTNHRYLIDLKTLMMIWSLCKDFPSLL